MSDAALETARRPGRVFWFLWYFDALVAAVVVFFFLWGLSDGSVSSFNITLWLGLLAVVGAVIGGSLALDKADNRVLSFGLLMVLALPGVAFGLFFALILVLQPRWN